jgi:hypothetical protein
MRQTIENDDVGPPASQWNRLGTPSFRQPVDYQIHLMIGQDFRLELLTFMSKVMMTVRSGGEKPSLKDLLERYHLSNADVDEDFGVIEIDPSEHVYTFLVEEAAAEKIADQTTDLRGPFSNPVIEDFRVR